MPTYKFDFYSNIIHHKYGLRTKKQVKLNIELQFETNVRNKNVRIN